MRPESQAHIAEQPYTISNPSIWTDVLMLMKFRLSVTVVFSSVMAYAISALDFSWLMFFSLAMGGILVTGAANALNQVLERDYDILMERTKSRPVTAGRMPVSTAVLIAGLSALVGTLLLTWIHPLAGFLGMLSLVIYSFVYTPMKRMGPSAVFVGAIPGALPVLIGSIAGSGEITMLGFILFGIQFFWQMPHFWAIAWIAFDDYKGAGFHLVPNRENALKPSIGTHAMIQALFILPVLWLGYAMDIFHWAAVLLVMLITWWYAWKAWQLRQKAEVGAARVLMFASFAYLPLVLIVFLIETMLR